MSRATRHGLRRLAVALLSAVAGLGVPAAFAGQPVEVSPAGTTSIPAIEVPSSGLMSPEGNASRVEHILTERSLKGRSIADLNAALFGPRLERTKAAYAVTVTPATVGGVPVLIYEPRAGVAKANRGKLLINLHGGGFVGCFVECGGLESIPIAALTGLRVISVDYRLAPAAQYPAASEDVAAVYRTILKTIPARRIGMFGCSAGGLLTAQSLAWFQHHGLPRPAAAGVFCAGGDPTMPGDSRIIGMLLGDGEAPSPPPQPGTAEPPALGYMRGAPPSDPAAFPAADRATLAAFPPTLIVTGTRDFAMSSAVNLHSRLVAQGVDARLHVWEAAATPSSMMSDCRKRARSTASSRTSSPPV
ncbi:alpha/beta hydrolase fold domain-containing protein [Phenylobacterium aquaticum]|uniref:alpha/beta hydrolase fold domain-containing protein n=1 Tax=Phenylobacterium aquaticum TaxID=1763816 RepID=UPI001F5DD370|nr:alpha/beta hydrolase fold domain-containing protein [Phenylobacterium aquaticum]MCI3131082.1 alpha/beta hydrolase [Phenylobacterium aquaticum]